MVHSSGFDFLVNFMQRLEVDVIVMIITNTVDVAYLSIQPSSQ